MKPLAIFTTPLDAHVELQHDDGPIFQAVEGIVEGRPAHLLSIDGVSDGHGAKLVVTKAGLAPVAQRGTLWVNRVGPYAEFVVDDILLNPSSGSGSLPPIPTRDQVCGIHISLQGLTVATQQFGTVKWFELWLQCCTALADRQACYAAKALAGDTHVIVEFRKGGPVYAEHPFLGFVSPDYEASPALFADLVAEIILIGKLTPIIVYDGDNGDNPVDGHPNALRQLPILYDLLKYATAGDLNPYVLKARLWDGVFYGSTPENIQAFGTAFRALDPAGYLAIEHNPGHIPVGEGGNDYLPGGRMDGYDVILSEFQTGAVPHDDTTFQIVGRLIRPYHRPPDQPVGDDPSPPFYLVDSPRGPRYYCAFEFGPPSGIYWWVRGQATVTQVETERQYYKDLGCGYTG